MLYKRINRRSIMTGGKAKQFNEEYESKKNGYF